MKNILLSIIFFVGTYTFATASENPPSTVNSSGSVSVKTSESSGIKTYADTKDNPINDSSKQTSHKSKKKVKPWEYIAAGALLVVIIVLYVATGGQGWNSRQ